MDRCFGAQKISRRVSKNKAAQVYKGQVVESIKCHAKKPEVYPEEKC